MAASEPRGAARLERAYERTIGAGLGVRALVVDCARSDVPTVFSLRCHAYEVRPMPGHARRGTPRRLAPSSAIAKEYGAL